MGLKTLLCSLLQGQRSSQNNHESLTDQAKLAELLKDDNMAIWVYLPATRHYLTITREGTFGEEYNPVSFSEHYNREDIDKMRPIVFDLCDGKIASAKYLARSPEHPDGSISYYEVNFVVSGRDEDGHTTSVLGIEYDVTEKVVHQRETSELLMRYHTVFNTALIDMIYYDKNGVLQDINEKACAAFHVPNRESVLDGSFLLQNNPIYSQIPLEQMNNTRTSAIISWGNYVADVYRLDEFNLSGKMYYESTINPIRNAQGQLEGIYMAGRDITEMVESFHRQQESVKKLAEATNNIKQYISNINYALQVSGVQLVNYYPDQYTLVLSNNVNSSQMRLSQLRCIRLGTPPFRRVISSALNRMDRKSPYPIETRIETEIRDKKGRPIWLLFNMVPMVDAEGSVERYFGMCRNITDLVETERQLVVETQKAHETETLKQSFLTNMSYEIRTPLNTVVGFAELFEADHAPEDESFFVEQIKKSSNELLHLTNDVLLLSRLDANMEEYDKNDTDFELILSNYCQVAQDEENATTITVEHPYRSLVVNIDEQHLGMVIERLCKLAVHYAKGGAVRVNYEYRRGELTVSIEDNGGGLDPAVLPHIFDRFIRNKNGKSYGTGLDLPIVKTLVEQMGGSIEMESTPGEGTNVWLAIPCEAKTVERRRDNSSNPLEPTAL